MEILEWDLECFGDGCIFLDTVVQPVFNFMAEQIALMGAAGEQPALRLGYDDINESACIAPVCVLSGFGSNVWYIMLCMCCV